MKKIMNQQRLWRVRVCGAMVFVLGGCASMMEDWRATHCNYDSAYAKGMQDQQNGEPLELSTFTQCDEPKRADALKGYREGYQKAMELESGTKVGDVSRGGVNINIGGKQIVNEGGGSTGQGYYCEVKSFMDKYEAFGPTRLQATKMVQEKCQKNHHEMHCRDVKCRKDK